MIITANSQHLAQALRIVAKIVPAHPAIQILGHVLIKADGELRLSTTDLEVSLSLACPAQISAPGVVALPAATLLQLIEQFTDGTVTIMAEPKGVKVQHGGFTSKLQSLPASEFPALQEPEGSPMKLAGNTLTRLITATRYAVAERGKKYVLEGALLKFTGASMGMVATDGARLSIITAARDGGPDGHVIVPRKTMDALGVLGTGPIDMLIAQNHIFFVAEGITLTSRVIDGKFPAYERIIPRDHDKEVVIERHRLIAALKRVGVAAELNCAIYLSLRQNAIRLSARSAAVGEADEQLPAQYEGDPLMICVNWKYLLDFLDASIGPMITIKVKNEKAPLLLADGVSFINVIMTMKG